MLEAIQTFFVFVGGVATLLGLGKLLRGRLKIRASGKHSTLEVSSTEKTRLAEFIQQMRDLAREEVYDRENKRKSAQLLREKWPAELFHEYGHGALKRPYYWNFKITNAGNAEARDLVLELPFDGTYVIDVAESIEFRRRINLGSLRTKGELVVHVWTSQYVYGSDRKLMRVTHTDGSVPVRVGHTVYGRFGVIAELIQESPIGALFTVVWFLFVGAWISTLVITALLKFTSADTLHSEPTTTKPTTSNSG